MIITNIYLIFRTLLGAQRTRSIRTEYFGSSSQTFLNFNLHISHWEDDLQCSQQPILWEGCKVTFSTSLIKVLRNTFARFECYLISVVYRTNDSSQYPNGVPRWLFACRWASHSTLCPLWRRHQGWDGIGLGSLCGRALREFSISKILVRIRCIFSRSTISKHEMKENISVSSRHFYKQPLVEL